MDLEDRGYVLYKLLSRMILPIFFSNRFNKVTSAAIVSQLN